MIFIYDRNILDITIVKEITNKIQTSGFFSLTDTEKQQWQAGLKGTLNHTDLNRIEGNSRDIAQMVGVSIEAPKVDWAMTDIPTQNDFRRILDNVRKIRSSNYVHSDTPVTPELPLNRYEKINDIERILFDVYDMYTRNMSAIYYINELYDEMELFDLMNKRNIDYTDEIWIDEEIGVL